MLISPASQATRSDLSLFILAGFQLGLWIFDPRPPPSLLSPQLPALCSSSCSIRKSAETAYQAPQLCKIRSAPLPAFCPFRWSGSALRVEPKSFPLIQSADGSWTSLRAVPHGENASLSIHGLKVFPTLVP